MKNLLTFITIGFLSLSAFATGDMEEVTLDCRPEVLHPDLGMNLQLLTGGFVGMRIEIKRSFLGHSQSEAYVVRQKPIPSHVLGAPITYIGKDIALSINYTVSPRHDGLHLATLVTKQNGTETLLCKVN